MKHRYASSWIALLVATGAFSACSGAVTTTNVDADAAPFSDDGGASDAGAPDGAVPPGDFDASPIVSPDDGVASHGACTSTFGKALTTAHGRLDGFLVSIVAPGGKACNADSGHVHLQVRMNGAIYDVAVTIVSDQGGPDPNVYVLEKDLTLPGDPWSEGWHTTNASLDYVTTLGVHANGFTSVAKATLTQRLTSELANANHISVYATGYGPDGAHKVHRNSANADGAIVINPTAAVSHAFLFHFATQSF